MSPAGPVIGFRRWRVTPDGQLLGLGVHKVWTTAHLTAECGGGHQVQAAEYCAPEKPGLAADWALQMSQYGLIGAPGRTAYPLPDGRWVRLVTKETCKPGLDPGHQVPSRRSACGIWAHKLPVPDCTCPDPEADRHGAVGVVRMWGKAVEHEDGWRAEHAELVAVVDHSGRLRDYGVPVYRSTAAMYAEWAPDAGGWAARHDPCWCGHGTQFLSNYYYSSGAALGSIVSSTQNYQAALWRMRPYFPPVPAPNLQQLYATWSAAAKEEEEEDEDEKDPKTELPATPTTPRARAAGPTARPDKRIRRRYRFPF